uniref:Major facilitator superfamily (MFS) profile domain-containing protein n=1 Tax=Moniliophthora roreri TaxID=221103 RepID=A0A0W0GE50_MONRR
MDSASERSERKEHSPGQSFNDSNVDVAARLTAGLDASSLDPQVAAKLRRKIDFHLMPLMCIMYLMTFADKTTLGQSAVLGIMSDAHLTQNQFNLLGSIFYISYLAFEYPQNLALQRFPVAKWMSINIFIWAVALLAHAACKSFGALFAVRFILGAAEAAITPAFLIVTSMFYTRQEQTRRVGYWFLMNGFAVIFLGFLAFGVLHTKASTSGFMPWQWLMIITGLLTLVTAVLFWFWFPDSPTTAYFLTPEERVLAVKRIQVNQTGVENKHWKREQFIETLKDSKVWVMALFSAISNLLNSLINQRQLIVNQFGFSVIQTTLIGCVDGVVEIVTIWVGVILATSKLGRGYAGILMFIPAILGCLLVNLLPSHMKVGLLFGYWLSSTRFWAIMSIDDSRMYSIAVFGIAPSAIFLGWISTLTSGHTKRITTNAIILIFNAIGNIAGPFVWKKQYQPRNHVPWALLAAGCGTSAILLFVLRTILAMENKRRESEEHDETYDNVYITHIKADGATEEKKVDKAFLDLTDKQNRDFRYVL